MARALEHARADREPVDDAVRWLHMAGLAAGCEKIYTGCERIMSLLAKRIDGASVDKTESWHADLLNRLANPRLGVRAAVISASCREGLDRFRSFRHRVRSHYGLHLDGEIVLARAGELGAVLDQFHGEVTAFLAGSAGEG